MKIKLVLIFLALISLTFTSCISNKQSAYMQQHDGLVEELMLSKQLPPYRVQINDVLSIRVKALDQELVGMFNPIGSDDNVNALTREALYSDGFLIDDHGEINMPTLGKIKILNLTVEEVKEKIEQQLLEQYFKKEANIFVTVKLGGVKYTTLGEFGSTGTKVIFQERVNIFEAIANSGDINHIGNKKDMLLIRPYPGGNKIHHIDLTDVNIFESPFFYIQPNDMLYIKPLPQKAWGTGTTGLQSFSTILSIFTALTTTYFLIRTL
ncbi:MAG: polysaccharide biosynthesis/export family protein [Flavobacteriaceae bacterium]